MEVVVLMNTMNRAQIAKAVKAHNQLSLPSNAKWYITDNGSTGGHEKFWAIDEAYYFKSNSINVGNPKALNAMLELVLSDPDKPVYIVKLDNDIKLPLGWFQAAIASDLDIVGFKTTDEPYTVISGDVGQVHPGVVLGSWVVKREVFEKCGYFNEFGLYGHWDATFCRRAKDNGFKAGYLIGYEGEHLCSRENDAPEYRKMKDEQATISIRVAEKWNQENRGVPGYLTRNQIWRPTR